MKYDYLIVGAGLFGAVFAHEAAAKGKKCLVIDKRNHIAGNIYTEKIEDIDVHKYGAHIFHTSDKKIWDYVNRFAEFNNYINSPVAIYNDVPYTRIIEHKHFNFGKQPVSIISREYSSEWKKGDEPYYPVNNEKNNNLYQEYEKLAKAEKNVLFGGRLGQYKYYDMDKVISAALDMCSEEL